jgi:Ran GTPase-activating protein (RanGAP) involved in mRNA processing and transport
MADVQEMSPHGTNEMAQHQQEGYDSAQQPGEPGEV